MLRLISSRAIPHRLLTTTARWHTSSSAAGGKKVNFTFVNRDGSKIAVSGDYGKSVLEVAHEHEVPLEGACEGSLACSTCHIILPADVFEKLQEPSEREEDLLDLAPGLEDTSRLGCQVKVDERLEGAEIKIPRLSINFYVDGHVPKPH